MSSLTTGVVAMFTASMALQLFMLSMLPLSKGYTSPLPTIAALVSLNLAFYIYARLIADGAQLSIMVPLSATVIPLCSIAIGVFFYGEPAPLLKLGLLFLATIIIGIASVGHA